MTIACKQPDAAATIEVELTGPAERIECIGLCHNGPIDASPKALRAAAQHNPEAPAAFLLVCPGCDSQWALCAKKVDRLLELAFTGGGMKCPNRIPIDTVALIPLNQA